MLAFGDFVEEPFDSDFGLAFVGLIEEFDEVKNGVVLG